MSPGMMNAWFHFLALGIAFESPRDERPRQKEKPNHGHIQEIQIQRELQE
jgi:hypothetical protein